MQSGAGRRKIVLRPQGDKRSPAPGAGPFGMGLFLASLSVLFAGSLVAFLWVRWDVAEWRPAGAPPLPPLLWVSTVLLIACSVGVQFALAGIRAGDSRRLTRGLHATSALACAFLVCQGFAWWSFFDTETFAGSLYAFGFYMLTGLHAAHVFGGLIALGVVSAFAHRGSYSWAHYPGVRLVAAYWHYLDAVWIVLFVTILLTH